MRAPCAHPCALRSVACARLMSKNHAPCAALARGLRALAPATPLALHNMKSAPDAHARSRSIPRHSSCLPHCANLTATAARRGRCHNPESSRAPYQRARNFWRDDFALRARVAGIWRQLGKGRMQESKRRDEGERGERERESPGTAAGSGGDEFAVEWKKSGQDSVGKY